MSEQAVGTALSWRAPTAADLPAWLELVQGAQRFDGDEPMSAEDLAASFESGAWSPEPDARLLALEGGELVADAVVAHFGATRDMTRIHLLGCVRPAERGRGIGRQVLAWQLERGAQRYAELDSDLPGRFEVNGAAGGPAERLYVHCGFEPVRYWSHMVHRLDGDTRPAREADGLRVAPYREDLAEQVRRAHNEAFADHWAPTVWEPAMWHQRAVGHPSFRPELSFVVLDGTRRDPTVAAYVLSYENEPDLPGGAPVGYLARIGTRRPWRGRGLGTALVCASLAAMRDAGYDRATLTVDAANPTGAVSLYERLGFVAERQIVSYQRPIGPSPST